MDEYTKKIYDGYAQYGRKQAEEELKEKLAAQAAEIERLRAALVEAGVNIESGWYTMALDGIDNALKGSDK